MSFFVLCFCYNEQMPQNHFSFVHLLFGENKETRRRILLSIKAKADSHRTSVEKLADLMTGVFGSMGFLVINIIVFTLWILINTGNINWVPVFDPYPFNLLTTIVSLEAIILATFVLISQNRSVKIEELREETNLQISLITEREITQLGKMIAILLEKQGIDIHQDPDLKKLLKPVSEEEIEKKLKQEIL